MLEKLEALAPYGQKFWTALLRTLLALFSISSLCFVLELSISNGISQGRICQRTSALEQIRVLSRLELSSRMGGMHPHELTQVVAEPPDGSRWNFA